MKTTINEKAITIAFENNEQRDQFITENPKYAPVTGHGYNVLEIGTPYYYIVQEKYETDELRYTTWRGSSFDYAFAFCGNILLTESDAEAHLTEYPNLAQLRARVRACYKKHVPTDYIYGAGDCYCTPIEIFGGTVLREDCDTACIFPFPKSKAGEDAARAFATEIGVADLNKFFETFNV